MGWEARRWFSAGEKIRIVIEGLWGEASNAEFGSGDVFRELRLGIPRAQRA